jgi:hypothetical protein
MRMVLSVFIGLRNSPAKLHRKYREESP